MAALTYRPLVDQRTVQVPEFSGDDHLALTPHEARILRAQLSRAINAGGPVLLSMHPSGGGPRFAILTVNEREVWDAPTSRKAVATRAQRGHQLQLVQGTWNDVDLAADDRRVDVAHNGEVPDPDARYLLDQLNRGARDGDA